MQKKRMLWVRFTQRLARLSAGALLAGIIAVSSLTLTGYTEPAQAAPPVLKAASPSVTVPAKPQPTTAPSPEVQGPSYDYTKPVPESEQVEDDWFSDAAFIGDSRTEGLVLYAKVKAGGSFAYRGLNVQTARTGRVIKMKDGTKKTAVDALKGGTYSKVYLSLGINELGWYNDERYYKNYAELIDQVRAAQPDAQIYLETLIPVTADKSASSYINNPQILAYNKLIQKLAEEKEVYLLDVWSAFADSSGALPDKGSVDGVHLTKDYYAKWRDYLKTHTVGGGSSDA